MISRRKNRLRCAKKIPLNKFAARWRAARVNRFRPNLPSRWRHARIAKVRETPLLVERDDSVPADQVLAKAPSFIADFKPATRPKWEFPQAGHCVWPIGLPGHDGFHFCGDPISAGRPYCPAHAHTAYVVVAKKRPVASPS